MWSSRCPVAFGTLREIALSTFSQPMASPQVTFVDMFRPPINRTMRVLDRSFFKKEVRLSAARVLKNQNIFLHRKELERNGDMLKAERLTMVRPDPQMDAQGRKCVLLRPEIKHDGKNPKAELWKFNSDPGR